MSSHQESTHDLLGSSKGLRVIFPSLPWQHTQLALPVQASSTPLLLLFFMLIQWNLYVQMLQWLDVTGLQFHQYPLLCSLEGLQPYHTVLSLSWPP